MQKVELITQTANTLTKKGDIENAKTLLAEAQKLLPEKYKNSNQLRVYVAYTNALSSLDTNQAFSLLENLILQANENINSIAKYYEFREETEYIKNDEFLIDSIEFQSAMHIYPSVPMIKKLVRIDFERTVKLADRFLRPEVHLFARWHIVESLLNKNAEVKEGSLASYQEGCG